MEEVSLKEMRKSLNEGKKILLYSGAASILSDYACILMEIDGPIDSERIVLLKKYPYLCGDISNIITPDKKELLMLFKIIDIALCFEKEGDFIKSTLIKQEYTNPMDLVEIFYNLPILTGTHQKLKTSIHKLNDSIISMGISEDLTRISKYYHPISEFDNSFRFALEEDNKSLKLVRRKLNKL